MACVTKSEQGRRFREFESLEWPVIQPDWVVVGVVLSRAVCSALGASGSLCAGCDGEKDARSNAQRSCPVARDAVVPQVHECDAFDFIRTALSLAYYCERDTAEAVT